MSCASIACKAVSHEVTRWPRWTRQCLGSQTSPGAARAERSLRGPRRLRAGGPSRRNRGPRLSRRLPSTAFACWPSATTSTPCWCCRASGTARCRSWRPATAGKAVYCAAALDFDTEQARQIKQRVEASGVAFMAEFPRRQAPATLRLKELIATRLGSPRLAVLPSARADRNAAPASGPCPRRRSRGPTTWSSWSIGAATWWGRADLGARPVARHAGRTRKKSTTR